MKPVQAIEALPLPPLMTATVPDPTLGVQINCTVEALAIPAEPTSMIRNRAVVRKVELNICNLSEENFSFYLLDARMSRNLGH